MSDDPLFPRDYFIVDVGMHDGKDAEYYARRGFKVVAFEANPALANDGAKRFKQMDLPIEIRNVAVADNPGQEVTFFINNQRTQWSSMHSDIGARMGGATEISVMSCDLADELENIQELLHMVKIDIEGQDLVALRQIGRLGTPPPYISVENGGEALLEEMIKIGYRQFKFSNQKYVPNQSIPPSSPHGEIVKHEFVSGSSGVFGEDLSGRWLSIDEIRTVSEALTSARRKARNNLFAETVGWFDLHAKLASD